MTGYRYIKRIIDILLSGLAIIILSPLLLILCIAIKLDSPGPIFFTQKRVGIHKTYFQIYKFRTMRTDTPKDMPTHMLANPEFINLEICLVDDDSLLCKEDWSR